MAYTYDIIKKNQFEWREDNGKTMGRQWEDNGKTMGRQWEDNGKTMGRQWGDNGETMRGLL